LEGDDTVIEAGRGKRERVQSTLNGLSVGSDDVVFFYYSGHGANPGEEDRWPILAVEGQSGSNLLKLSDVKNTLQSKNPRLLITMADACNVFVEGVTRGGKQVEDNQPSGFKKLFLNYSGTITASSSMPGQYSFGDPQDGGRFTVQFLESLNQVQASSNPDWETVQEKSTQKIQVDHPEQKNQTPQMKVKVTMVGGKRDNSNEWSCAADTDNTPILPSNGSDKEDPPPPSTSNYPKCADGDSVHENGKDCCLDRSGSKRCFKD
jgi:hypothetical protein